MKKIIFVTRELVLGGAAFLTLRYIDRLIPHFEIHLLVAGPVDSKMLELVSPSVSFFHFPKSGEKDPIDAMEAFWKIEKTVGLLPFNQSYDAVIATSLFPSWEASLAYSLIDSRVKYAFLLDESLNQYAYFNTAVKVSTDVAIAATHTFLPVSRKLWQKIAMYCPSILGIPIYVAQPIVEVEKRPFPLKKSESEATKVLTVARLSPEKQIPESLYIHRRLIDKGVLFKWYIIGAGQQMDFLQNEIRRLGMQDYFILLGPMANSKVFEWMMACDALVLFSQSEGCPTVVMEALVMNRPVLATDVNGIDELIQNGETGLIIQNNAHAMEAGLEKLVVDKELRQRLVNNLINNPRERVYAEKLANFIEKVKTQTATTAMKPRVTILIIAYNHGNRITKAIASAISQDYEELEVVVLDDASTDDTGTQAKQWCSFPGFRYECNAVNLGRVKNYRKAISEVATTEWVLILDGDDYLTDSKFISKAILAIEQLGSTSTMMVQAGHRVVIENQMEKNIDILPVFPEDARIFQNADYVKFVYETGFFTHLGTLFRREEAVKVGCYTADISSTDMDGLLRLALEGNVIILNQIAGNWIQHGQNASSQLDFKEVIDNVRLFRTIANLAKNRNLITNQGIDSVLNTYQARTLASLFFLTLSQKPHHPKYLFRMLQTTWRIHPQLFLQKAIQRSILRYSKKSVKHIFSQFSRKVRIKKKQS